MSDENKKNRVDLGNSTNDNFEQPVQDDFDNTHESKAGNMVFVFMFLIIIALLVSSYMIYKDKEKLKRNISVVKEKLVKIEKDKNQKLKGNLHIKIEDPEKDLPEEEKISSPGVEIYINGELRSDKSGIVDIPEHDISQALIFEFKKPGYYPIKFEIKSCNWKKQGETYIYKNEDIHLVKDENGMMAIEAAKKEKDKEAKERQGKKKKKRRR